MNSKKIRKSFLEFFQEKNHEFIRSSSVVPSDDPTLLFTNAGMNQFKPIFLGEHKADYQRAVNTQKCIRVSGKHNDLEEVGVDVFHHTFFEMLGNWSFGDYYKKEAIKWSWELFTDLWGLDKSRLWVTVYKDDDEAHDLWLEQTDIKKDRVLRFGDKENFWEMGDTGPCGPCSEIHYYVGEEVDGQDPNGVNNTDEYWELWNLVFIQYDRQGDGTLLDLPEKHIDTGAGLERIVTVLQNKKSNYETDLFQPIITGIENITGTKYNKNKVSHHVIADHIRMLSFAIADGAMPSNEGRGYVLRRILRRASRYGRMLKKKDPFLYKLVDQVIEVMGESFPELVDKKTHIQKVIESEEISFNSTLERGLIHFEKYVNNNANIISGDEAFKLYDTYGFPLDLTEDLLRDKNLKLDKDSFNSAMKKQKEEAKRSWVGSGDKKTDEAWFEVSDISSPTEFLGYTNYESMGKVTAIIKDSKLTNNIKEGDEAILFLNQTPFYAESGGQLGDIGKIISDKVEFEVTDTKKKINNFHAHIGKLKKGNISIEDLLSLKVDIGYRKKITANHSATHLLHETLRRVLGEHVTQKGSKVSAEKLRFDFSHQKALEDKEIAEVESTINQMIGNNSKVDVKILPYDSALKEGALALFGEKYTDEVRVLSMGDNFFSKELCGGTHVDYLKEIVEFKITSQNSVASGVRRVEAMTGQLAKSNLSFLEKISDKTKIEKNKKDSKSKNINISKDVLNGEVIEFGNIKFYFDVVKNLEAKDLRFLTDECKKDLGTGVSCIISDNDEKSSIAIGVTNDISDEFDAVELIKMSAKIMDGKGGGGRSDMALAGANNINKSDEVFDALKEEISKKS